MRYEMKLDPTPFVATRAKKKTIEIRLNDEKRRGIKPGDEIVFKKLPNLKEELRVRVVGVREYKNATDLVASEPINKTGGIYTSTQDWLDALNGYYSKDQQLAHGILSIEIVVI